MQVINFLKVDHERISWGTGIRAEIYFLNKTGRRIKLEKKILIFLLIPIVKKKLIANLIKKV